MKTYKDRKHKSSRIVTVGTATFIGKSAKKARKSLAPALDAWEKGEGRLMSHGHQKPGSLKI